MFRVKEFGEYAAAYSPIHAKRCFIQSLLIMQAKDMVQYKRTWSMEQLHLMLKNDSKAYELWHGKAVKYAKKMLAGEAVLMDNLAMVMIPIITHSCDRLINWYRRVICEPLSMTSEQKGIVAWQWFYNDMMETYDFYKKYGRQN